MCEFKRQEPMDLSGIVSIALQVPVYNVSDRFRIDIRARQRPLVEKHFADVVGKFVAVPDLEMKHLVTTQPDALQVKRSEQVVHLSDPLWHAVVIGIFSFE